MNLQDREFQKRLEVKYHSVPNGSPVEVCRGGRHSDICHFELFVLISGCGCVWEECSCGYRFDIRKCPSYRETIL